ncbi:MAG: N-acyl-D-amino-acid deacylase family protein [Actinomycetota bacterium]
MPRLVVKDASVVDGSGSPARRASVAVEGDHIVEVTERPDLEGERIVDARGLVLAPGFVDTHSHADLSPFVEPSMDSAIRQGITTVVVGYCGASPWPNAGLEESAQLVGMTAVDLPMRWSSYAGYLDAIDEARPACNVATLVGQGAVRGEAMGGERRPPTDDELDAMRRLVAEAVEAGAVGMSTGLIYPPGMHAGTDEIVEHARVAGERGGLYASHIRDEGRAVFDAVAEAIRIGREGGLPAPVSHLKVESSYAWGRAEELLASLDRARADGADVSADQYPYTAWETSLATILPPWAPVETLGDLVPDGAPSERLVDAIEHGEPGWGGNVDGIGWERIVIGSHQPDPSVSGRSVAELATDRSSRPVDVALGLLLADPFTGMIGHGMLEEDVRLIASRPDVMVGTDGVAIAPDGPLGRFSVHPRYYGTFPRVLARYVREEGLLDLPAAIRKMTSVPAERFGLRGRGRIAAGAFADLVLFDPDRIEDVATFERPHAFPNGIDVVVVNGAIAWDGERGERAGRVLRRG